MGWLVTELKDFMTIGGVTNQLAFGLLKICFILFLIAITMGGIVFPEVVMEALSRMRDTKPKKIGNEVRDDYNRGIGHRRINSQ